MPADDARPLRVLFAIPALDQGGPDRVFFELLCALDRRRFAPALLVSEPDGHYLGRLPADVPVEVLGGGTSTRARYPVAAAARAVRRLAPDVVLATLRMTYTMSLAAPLLPRRTRLVLRQANAFSTDFDALVRTTRVKHRLARELAILGLRAADAVVCQSDDMARDLRARLGPRARLHVIGNPIDVDRALRAADAEAPAPPGAPALVSVGRLFAQKGFDLLLPALAALRGRHPGLHLTVLGDGPDRAALEAQAARLGLQGTVTFAGFCAAPLPVVRRADLFVLASRFEGFPNAALEALACGTPVVLTDCPGANAQLVVPGVNGRLAAAVTPEAVARALDEALAERAAYDRAAITADCRARFAAARIVGAYEDLLARVARGEPGAAR